MRKRLKSLTLFIVTLSSLAPPVNAQTPAYPTRTIEIIVPYGAGGSTDFVARTIGQKLQEKWGQPAVVLNRPGGSGTIGTAAAARAAPDGYTLLVSFTSEMVIAPQTNKNIKYSISDFEPIAVTGIVPVVLIASKNIKADNLRDLIAEIRQAPGKYTFGGGAGSPSHILGSWLSRIENLDVRHIPGRDGAQLVADVVGGHVDLFFAGTSVAKPAIDSGAVKAIAVTGVRSSAMPQAPTFKEAGLPDFELASWNVMLAPREVPGVIIAALRKEVLAILNDPKVRKILADQGVEASTTQDTRAFLAHEHNKFGRVLRDIGLTAGP